MEADISGKRRYSIFRQSFNEARAAYLYLLPSLVVMFIALVYPMIEASVQSLYRWNPLRYGLNKKFVLFQNYQDIFSDPLFYKTLWNSLFLTVASVGIEFILGLGIALLLYGDIKCKGLFKTAVIVPMMMAPMLAGLIWKLFLDSEFGLFNHILRMIHVPTVNWVGSATFALPTIIIVEVWQYTSFVILVLLAGLQAIPVEQFEAAEVDGASQWQRLIHIILPWLKPLILIVILFRVLFVFRTFDTIFLLLGSAGGVANNAMVFGIYLYHKAFMLFNLGRASGISIIMLVLTAALSIVFAVTLYRTLKV